MSPERGSLDEVAAAYSDASGAWAEGPARIYGRLAVELVERCPGGVAGRTGLDLGAGTGAASQALVAAGAAQVVALDAADGMLRHDARRRPPAVVGDALRLPFGDGSFDAVVAAFSLNHVSDPAAALAEAARTVRPGGGLVASAYADDDTHPVKETVDAACRVRGWEPPPWYAEFRDTVAPLLSTVAGAGAAVGAAGLEGATVDRVAVAFPELQLADLLAWRLGMAQVSGFVRSLSRVQRSELVDDVTARVGECPELVRRFVVVAWHRDRG